MLNSSGLTDRAITQPSLILDQLLPLARQGLTNAHVASEDIDKYLGIIEERTRGGQTGARWMMKSLSAIGSSASKDASHRRLTAEILANQKRGEPVHRWPVIEKKDSDEWEHGYRTVGQFMSTDLFTVSPDDLIDLAASVMDWRHIRHVPVEDQEGRLVGLVTHRGLLRMMIKSASRQQRCARSWSRTPSQFLLQPHHWKRSRSCAATASVVFPLLTTIN